LDLARILISGIKMIQIKNKNKPKVSKYIARRGFTFGTISNSGYLASY